MDTSLAPAYRDFPEGVFKRLLARRITGVHDIPLSGGSVPLRNGFAWRQRTDVCEYGKRAREV
jgi:hypothetical protein